MLLELTINKGKKNQDEGDFLEIHNSNKTNDLFGDDRDDKDAQPQSWVKKVKLPTFNGKDPLVWIARTQKNYMRCIESKTRRNFTSLSFVWREFRFTHSSFFGIKNLLKCLGKIY